MCISHLESSTANLLRLAVLWLCKSEYRLPLTPSGNVLYTSNAHTPNSSVRSQISVGHLNILLS
jgi:hypothetical protein